MSELQAEIQEFERATETSKDVERELLWELGQWETEAIKAFAEIERRFRRALHPLKLETWSGDALAGALPDSRSDLRGVTQDLRAKIRSGFGELRSEYESAIEDLRKAEEDNEEW